MEKFTQAPVGLDIDQTVSSNSTAIANLNNDMGKTNIHVDVSSQTYNTVAGATALYNALPTQFKGTCYATFTSGYNAVCLVDKHSATYGSIIYEVDWDVSPFHFVMKNGTATLNQLATKSYVDQWTDISSQFTYSSTYVGTLVAKTDGNWVQLYVNVKKGTPDQTTVATIPNAYKPSMTTAFSIFYMHGEDMGRNCTGCIDAASASVQFRCATTPTGTYGVRLSCVYHI